MSIGRQNGPNRIGGGLSSVRSDWRRFRPELPEEEPVELEPKGTTQESETLLQTPSESGVPAALVPPLPEAARLPLPAVADSRVFIPFVEQPLTPAVPAPADTSGAAESSVETVAVESILAETVTEAAAPAASEAINSEPSATPSPEDEGIGQASASSDEIEAAIGEAEEVALATLPETVENSPTVDSIVDEEPSVAAAPADPEQPALPSDVADLPVAAEPLVAVETAAVEEEIIDELVEIDALTAQSEPPIETAPVDAADIADTEPVSHGAASETPVDDPAPLAAAVDEVVEMAEPEEPLEAVAQAPEPDPEPVSAAELDPAGELVLPVSPAVESPLKEPVPTATAEVEAAPEPTHTPILEAIAADAVVETAPQPELDDTPAAPEPIVQVEAAGDTAAVVPPAPASGAEVTEAIAPEVQAASEEPVVEAASAGEAPESQESAATPPEQAVAAAVGASPSVARPPIPVVSGPLSSAPPRNRRTSKSSAKPTGPLHRSEQGAPCPVCGGSAWMSVSPTMERCPRCSVLRLDPGAERIQPMETQDLVLLRRVEAFRRESTGPVLAVMNASHVSTGDLAEVSLTPEQLTAMRPQGDSHLFGSFGLCVLPFALEQSREPVELLRSVHDMLVPGGRLLVASFDPLSLRSLIFGTRWSGLRLPGQVFSFRRQHVERMLREAGFEKPRVERVSGCLRAAKPAEESGSKFEMLALWRTIQNWGAASMFDAAKA